MTGKDKDKKSSHHRKSGSSSKSNKKKSSSSSSSHRESSSRTTRDTRLDTTQDDNEEEYDDIQYSEEGIQEGHEEAAYARDDGITAATQRRSAATTGLQSRAAYAPPTSTQQPFGTLGAIGQSYPPRPIYDTQRTLEGTGPGAEASAAAGPGLVQTTDNRSRPWQGIPNVQHRAAVEWDTIPPEQRTMDDGVNRIGDEDDNTGS